MRSKKIIMLLFAIVSLGTANAQYTKGQWGIGGEFSFINSRNSVSRSTTDFTDSYSNGFSLSLVGGKFINGKTFLYGVADFEYVSFKRDLILDNVTNRTEQDIFSSTFTAQLGVGARRYYSFNEKNIVGLFLQGQLKVGNSWVNQRNFASRNDSVYNDLKLYYPVRIISVNINPGVYVNITPQWQLTLNVGNLYFTQTIVPEFATYSGNRNNSSFGLDVNLFDFRLGVLYTPRKE